MEEKANNISRTSYTFHLTQKLNGYMGTSQTNYTTWHLLSQTTEYKFVHNSDTSCAYLNYYLKTRSHTRRAHHNLRTKVNRLSTSKTAHFIIIKKKNILHTTHNIKKRHSFLSYLGSKRENFEITHDYQLHYSTLSYLVNEMKT